VSAVSQLFNFATEKILIIVRNGLASPGPPSTDHGATSVLVDFDQSALANMTAAPDYVCKRIPSDSDSRGLRKRIGDAIIACANSGKQTYVDFQMVGEKTLSQALKPTKAGWLPWKR
jgi:hypothetical protein